MQTVAIAPNAVPQEVPLSLLMESATNPRQHLPGSIRPSLPDRRMTAWRLSLGRGVTVPHSLPEEKPSPHLSAR
jgi:hypothetical protein